MMGQPPCRSGSSMPSPGQPGRALLPGMGKLQAELGAGVGVDEVDDAPPRGDVLGLVHAGTARRDAGLSGDIGHLGIDEAGAADGEAAEMNQMPVVGRAVLGRVLAHRRDDDAVLQRYAAQAERGEHGRWRRVERHVEIALAAHFFGEPPIHARQVGGIARAQIFVGHALGAAEEAENVLIRLHVVVAPRILVPL